MSRYEESGERVASGCDRGTAKEAKGLEEDTHSGGGSL